MGIFSGRDLLSSKFTTAIITDVANHMYFIPIKNVLGEYFMADIEGEVYCFKIESSREKTYRHKGVKSFKVLWYDTNHYMPVSPENNKELEIVLRANALPRVNGMLLGTLKLLGKKEKHEKNLFTPHHLKELVEEVSQHETEYKDQVRNLRAYFNSLKVDQIITPVKKISEFLEDDLLTSHPQFFGSVVSQYERTDLQHKKVTNIPITGRGPWLKFILLMVVIGLGIGLVLYLYSTGAFSHLVPTIGPSAGPTSQPTATAITANNELLKKYPTPEDMVNAINSKALDCKTLNPEIVKMVNTAKGGTCP